MKGSVVWPNIVASLQMSFGVRLSRIHFMRDKRTPKEVCGEATNIRMNTGVFPLMIAWTSGNIISTVCSSQCRKRVAYARASMREFF